MVKNRDKLNHTPSGGEDNVFSLEEILAEYSSETDEETGDRIPIPVKPPEEPEDALDGQSEKVIRFPSGPQDAESSPLADGLRKLREAEDEYAGRMFEEEARDPEELLAEELIPGTDEEQAPVLRRERRPCRAPERAPDLPPDELSRRLGDGLGSLKLRSVLVFLLSFLLLAVAALSSLGISLPADVLNSLSLQVYLSAGLLVLSMALGADLLGRGLFGLVSGRPGAESLIAVSCAVTLADSLTMLRLGGRGSLPYCCAASLSLGFALAGTYLKRNGLRLSCRTAAAAAEPYLVTLDEGKWNGRNTYAKASAPIHGFGSQIQGEDGAERIFRRAVPLLLLASFLCSVISALGTRQPEHLLWCLSAMTTACASFSALLCFGLPMSILSVRLAKSGAALAGWEGACRAERNNGILLTDTDLFPPGSVSLNGIKIFGDFPVEKVIAVTAALIHASGSGLDKTFHDLLRSQGLTNRRISGVSSYEGGLQAELHGEQILVGTASFMSLMKVLLPQGLGVKNAVFCAVDGELAGIFALNYTLQNAVSPSLTALIRNKIRPVLATRDFNLIPSMLFQRFKLPTDKMEFPVAERRLELSDLQQEHSGVITAVLCREGLGPYSEAVVGARRLRQATLLSAGLSAAGCTAGLLLTFYLTFVSAYYSLSPLNLTVFQFLWAVPTLLISGWVDRY
jgi:hypothetical protein